MVLLDPMQFTEFALLSLSEGYTKVFDVSGNSYYYNKVRNRCMVKKLLTIFCTPLPIFSPRPYREQYKLSDKFWGIYSSELYSNMLPRKS